MMFERFTDRGRRILVLAQEEARMLNHNYIGTEHMLLGLIHADAGVAAKALESVGVSREAVIGEIEQFIGRGQQVPSGHVPFTPRTKKLLELSLREALQLGHSYIGAEHILLAILRLTTLNYDDLNGAVGVHILQKLNIDFVRLRNECLQLLRVDDDPAPLREPVALTAALEDVNPVRNTFAGVLDNLSDEIAALRNRADAHFQSARELEQIAERLENISELIRIAGEE